MPSSTPPYLSYLMRLWLACDEEHPQCCLGLIDPHSGENRRFASLEELTAYLQGKVDDMTTPEERTT